MCFHLILFARSVQFKNSTYSVGSAAYFLPTAFDFQWVQLESLARKTVVASFGLLCASKSRGLWKSLCVCVLMFLCHITGMSLRAVPSSQSRVAWLQCHVASWEWLGWPFWCVCMCTCISASVSTIYPSLSFSFFPELSHPRRPTYQKDERWVACSSFSFLPYGGSFNNRLFLCVVLESWTLSFWLTGEWRWVPRVLSQRHAVHQRQQPTVSGTFPHWCVFGLPSWRVISMRATSLHFFPFLRCSR